MESKSTSTEGKNIHKQPPTNLKFSHQEESKDRKNGSRDVDGDTQEIISDAAHQPDRDQLFDRGHRSIPGKAAMSGITGWSGDTEERVMGDRDFKQDAVDDLDSASLIAETHGPSSANPDRTEIGGSAIDINFEEMPDTELERWADTLGVAGRSEMSRHQLIQEIRTQLQH